jgi:hypothetical protein
MGLRQKVRNHMMSAHRLSDLRHSQLLGRSSFLIQIATLF